MITGAQIKAARDLLGWSLDQLAEEAGVLVLVVGYAEAGHIDRVRPQTIDALRTALEAAGVIFVAENGEVDVGMLGE